LKISTRANINYHKKLSGYPIEFALDLQTLYFCNRNRDFQNRMIEDLLFHHTIISMHFPDVPPLRIIELKDGEINVPDGIIKLLRTINDIAKKLGVDHITIHGHFFDEVYKEKTILKMLALLQNIEVRMNFETFEQRKGGRKKRLLCQPDEIQRYIDDGYNIGITHDVVHLRSIPTREILQKYDVSEIHLSNLARVEDIRKGNIKCGMCVSSSCKIGEIVGLEGRLKQHLSPFATAV